MDSVYLFHEVTAIEHFIQQPKNQLNLKLVVTAVMTSLGNWWKVIDNVTSKKSSDVYESCPKLISLENFKKLSPSQKLPKNVGDLGKLFVAKGFEKLPIDQ